MARRCNNSGEAMLISVILMLFSFVPKPDYTDGTSIHPHRYLSGKRALNFSLISPTSNAEDEDA